ncbi:methionine--tRNA ligase [Candidatus Parcubacteria bacterium]|nr:MAG: methionine--tRNA ligase [Candidatus Parcubacteria bacterium]
MTSHDREGSIDSPRPISNGVKNPLYITTTLPYVNADPHIGFALEIVHADIYARYRTLQGDDVFFNTGTDEHGQKLYEAAQKAGKTPQAYVDEYAAKFRSLKDILNLDPAIHFIRTTDAHHIEAAQEMWRRCQAAGDIEKRTYKGLYCVGDEAFMKDSDLVDGRCPNHPNMDLVELEEENYFFLLSKYQKPLLDYLSREGVILPEWRRQEAIKFVERGLEDFSISRVKEKMPWGIPVPDDDSQVMYVWFDALTNYISTLGWPHDTEKFETYWGTNEVPNAIQMAGKDQVRFQSIMWQAMLKSAGLPSTKSVIYHGFITSGGQKMSKSLGNVIDPMAIVQEYGTDALRYFLARHVHPFEDTDVTMEKFKQVYNADLANGLGNLAARIMKLTETHLEGPVELPKMKLPSKEAKHFDAFEINRGLDYVWERIQLLDQKITTTEPFKVVKVDLEKGKTIIAGLVRDLAHIAACLEPVMPHAARAIGQSIKENKKPENVFPRKE